MKIDITKKYKTKCGEEVTDLHVEPSGDYPICGLVGGYWEWWTEQGDFYIDDTSVMDLVLVEDEHKVELPEPPVGMMWKYRGKGAKFKGHCLFMSDERGEVKRSRVAYGYDNLQYWQAVPVVFTGIDPAHEGGDRNVVANEITTKQKLAIAVEALQKARGWAVADEALSKIL